MSSVAAGVKARPRSSQGNTHFVSPHCFAVPNVLPGALGVTFYLSFTACSFFAAAAYSFFAVSAFTPAATWFCLCEGYPFAHRLVEAPVCTQT